MLTKREKNSIIHAVCIGDGHLRLPPPFSKTARKPGYQPKNYQLELSHDIKQLDFLRWKRDLLEECLDKKINIRIWERTSNFRSNVKRKLCSLTVSDVKFNKVYSRLYKEKKKVLTKKLLNRFDERGLAIWFGDDGYTGFKTGNRYGKIYPNQQYTEIIFSTNDFDRKSHEKFAEYLRNKWDINAYINSLNLKDGRSYLRIYISQQQSSNRFLGLVSPFLKDLKSMRHKLYRI